ncbi:alginate lyase family protein [Halomarina salina]|uniref:Alginate lyase family protein n=1 Tax=Halomarina salina TaxID=1872699 RepID=A0ABD5RIA4_9EURY|nr:alginate lyase family protein [Halomarina salina]
MYPEDGGNGSVDGARENDDGRGRGRRWSRRRVLGATGALAAGAAAGCIATNAEGQTGGDSEGGSDPALFADRGELAAVKRRVDAGDEPWASAYESFIADADESLDATPKSVTDGDGSNLFESSDPDDDTRGDYVRAIEMGDRIRDLGLAYEFTGDDAYAERAVEFVDHWYFGDTRMTPEETDTIELYITLPKMWYGAELVRDHPAWDDVEGSQEGLADWIRTYFETVGTDVPDWVQNIFVWRETAHAAGAAYLGDEEELTACFDRLRDAAFVQLDDDGLLEEELDRSEGLSYSLYALKAFVTAAELGRHYGESFYDHERFGGSALKLMFDAHAPFFFDPESFDERFGESGGFAAREREEGTSAYELAYSYWGDDRYLDVVESDGSEITNEPTYVEQHQDAIDAKGRPVRDERLLGWTTLTHGNRFDLDLDEEGESDERSRGSVSGRE